MRPTLDMIVIYGTCMGCAIFPKVGKSIKHDLQQSIKMAAKIQPGAFQNPLKNEDKKKHQKLMIWASKLEHNGRKKTSRWHPKRPPKTLCRNTAPLCHLLGTRLGCFWRPVGRLEPAENPPYEPQAKIPKPLQLLRRGFTLRQTLQQKRLEQKVGRRFSPHGGH